MIGQRNRRPKMAVGRRIWVAPALALFGLIRGGVPAHSAGPPPDWSAMTTQDLAAMRALIEDNHPGPVDDRNPGFKTWLQNGVSSLRAQAVAARTEHDYR